LDGGWAEALSDPTNAVRENLDPVASDSTQIEIRGVRESHPTPVSQGLRRLALLLFEFEPAKSSFEDTP
jgi:hypothetical protein